MELPLVADETWRACSFQRRRVFPDIELMNPSPGRTTSSSSGRYSYHIPPPPGQFLCQSDPLPENAPSFPARACQALQDYLESSAQIGRTINENLRNKIGIFCETMQRMYHDEGNAMSTEFAAELDNCVSSIIEDMAGGRHTVSSQPADRRYSHKGGRNVRTVCREDNSVVSAYAWQSFAQPSDMLKHAAALSARSFDFVPQAYPAGPESVLVKLFLHMFHSCPNRFGEGARVGVLFDGMHIMFAERYENPPNHHGLVVSRLYACIDGQEIPTIPLLATLTAMSHPGVVIPPPPIPPQRLPSISRSPLASRLVALVDLTDSSATLTNGRDNHKAIQSLNLSDSSATKAAETFNTLYFAVSPKLPSTQVHQQFAARNGSPLAGTSNVSASAALYRVPEKEALLLGRQLLHMGPDTISWRAQLVDGGPGFIAKVFHEEVSSAGRAAREARAMKTVAMRCGDIVPSVHGLFAWPTSGGGFDEGGMLLLQDAGEALGDSFSSFEVQDRLDVWKIMTSLHECGIRHGDVDPRHFARGHDGILRLVDLGKVDLTHQCKGPSSCYELADLHSTLCAVLPVLPPD